LQSSRKRSWLQAEKAIDEKSFLFWLSKIQSTEYVETMYRTFFHGLDPRAREELTAKTFLRNHEEKGFRRHDLESVLRIRAKNPTTHPKAMFDA